MKKLWHYLRYDWPLHFMLLFTNWLPDNVFFLRVRGVLVRLFFGKCGHDLRVGRNVLIHNPELINLGDHVYIAYGSSVMGNDLIRIEDEVLLSPYCVIVSGNHSTLNGSYRYGPALVAPIVIGKGSWIASHVVVTAGCTIAENCLIAANAVVTQNIPANVIAGGIPARIINQNPPS